MAGRDFTEEELEALPIGTEIHRRDFRAENWDVWESERGERYLILRDKDGNYYKEMVILSIM